MFSSLTLFALLSYLGVAFSAAIPITNSEVLAPRAAATQALISVYNLSNQASPPFMGYLKAASGFTYGVTSDPNAAVVVSAQLDDLNPGDISLLTGNFGYSVLGFSGNYTSLASGSHNFQFLVAADPIAKNSPAQRVSSQSITNGGLSYPTETAVWTLTDASSLTIKPTWINPDGSQATTSLVYTPYFKNFLITGDARALSNWLPEAWSYPVRFELNTEKVPSGYKL